MKKIILFIIAVAMAVSFAGCSSKTVKYDGKIGLYDAQVWVDGDNMILAFDIVEEGTNLTVVNKVKIVGAIKEVNGSIYDVDFANENTVIYLKYEVSGPQKDAYLSSLTLFLKSIVKSEEDKALIDRLGNGEEIAFDIGSALYTSLSGMPGRTSVRLFKNDKTFTIS